MLLTLGLTADAAAAHRHEFSAHRRPVPAAASTHADERRATLPPSYSFPVPRVRRPLNSLAPPTSALPSHRHSMPSENAPTIETVMSTTHQDATDPSDESEDESNDGDLLEHSGSSIAEDVVPNRRKQRHRKPHVRFQLAHPPPAVTPRQMLHIRPRLLLQLQYLPTSARPTPYLDVHPAKTFAPRLARKFPRFFKGKEGLGPDDLVVVGSEEYGAATTATEDGHGDNWDARQLIATICRSKKEEEKTEICLIDGPGWAATRLKTGAYEFVVTDGQGHKTTARWVPRKSLNRRVSTSSAQPAQDLRKFHFSLLNPQSRRHPILASITPSTLEIHDDPSMPLSAVSRPSSAESSARTLSLPGESSLSGFTSRTRKPLVQSDEALQTLILITGIWVAFREGWSQGFRYNEAGPGHHHHHHFPHHPKRTATAPPGVLSTLPTPRSRASSQNVRERTVRSASSVSNAPALAGGTTNGGPPMPRRIHSTPATHSGEIFIPDDPRPAIAEQPEQDGVDSEGPPSIPPSTSLADDKSIPSAAISNGSSKKSVPGPTKEKRRWGKLRGILSFARGHGGSGEKR
ncbi:MAG: nucleotidyltransferase [Chaenotheca gracillima]|nr:MAG: nucleotidyltransferase [Chaenotheca gracillima]